MSIFINFVRILQVVQNFLLSVMKYLFLRVFFFFCWLKLGVTQIFQFSLFEIRILEIIFNDILK